MIQQVVSNFKENLTLPSLEDQTEVIREIEILYSPTYGRKLELSQLLEKVRKKEPQSGVQSQLPARKKMHDASHKK